MKLKCLLKREIAYVLCITRNMSMRTTNAPYANLHLKIVYSYFYKHCYTMVIIIIR